MKKIYLAPEIELLECETEQFIAASGISGVMDDVDLGIDYGGIDTDGSYDPYARAMLDVLEY